VYIYSFAFNVSIMTTHAGNGTWHPRRAATGAPHTYEELSENGGGNYYECKPPVPPHAASDDSSLYSKPPGGKLS